MPMRRLSRKVPLPGKWEPKEYLAFQCVLEANPAHVKALLCRRGMANLEVGDFEEARGDFEMMMKADKSFEPDATAAFKKAEAEAAGCGEEGKEKIAVLERITEGKSRVQMKTTKRRMVLSPVANW
ncbi:hypothetical protein NC651_015657 [Populus alba x Populus x berolinensis]|nr:hypothetical protein NC651_015657 [Populus alba x Populus x berolinensis]